MVPVRRVGGGVALVLLLGVPSALPTRGSKFMRSMRRVAVEREAADDAWEEGGGGSRLRRGEEEEEEEEEAGVLLMTVAVLPALLTKKRRMFYRGFTLSMT